MTFFVDFHTCCIENGRKRSHLTIIILQFTASSCHWIVYEGVLALDTTIFDGWHCEYDHLWYGILRVKILK